MDEPVSALDPISAGKIEDLVVELKKDYTIIMVTHELGLADRAKRNIFVRDGQVSDGAPELHLASMAAG